MTTTRLILGLIALTALAGCQSLEDAIQPPPPVATQSHATYCYRTLGTVDCYLAPRQGDRLVGIDIPPPVKPVKPNTDAPAPNPRPAPPPPVTSEPIAAPMTEPPPPLSNGPAQLSPYGNGGRRTEY